MDSQTLQSKLSVDQRACCAKIQVLVFNELEKCKNDQEVAMFYHYLTNKLQIQATNRVLGLTGKFVEIVKEEKTDAVEEAQHT